MLAPAIRFAMRLAYCARRLALRLARRPSFGAHGVVLTPAGAVVLVRLTYAPGWHLPGGGLKRGEAPEAGALRELREEIGLRAWTSVAKLNEGERIVDGRRERNSLYLVRDAVYRPRWSLEIAEARPFDRAALPTDLMPWARAAVERAS